MSHQKTPALDAARWHDTRGAVERIHAKGGVASISGLARHRIEGTGPRYYQLNKKHIRYAEADLDEWTAAQFVPRTSTAEYMVKK